MKKQLLSIAMLAAISTGAMAHEIGDKVYSNSARFVINGKNLVTNGDFSDLQLGGWTATDESIDKLTTFSVLEGKGANGANEIKVIEGNNALTNGIYQIVDIEKGGTYIVSMKVMNLTAAGFTDFDLTGSNINYINAYYNTDGALATAGGDKNKVLNYGTDGVCGGYTFSFNSEGFTTVNFPVVAPANGKIVIDLRALADGVEICDVTCQEAEQIYDKRIPAKRIEYIEKVLNSYDFTERASYFDLTDEIAHIKEMIAEDAEDGYKDAMDNLENYWNEFTDECFSNVLNFINGGNPGDGSANWDNWTCDVDKLANVTTTNASGWTWSTDRWRHKTKAVNSPLGIAWARTTAGPYDNIATNTTTLDKGTYFFGVQGAGGMMTLNKERWARSQAFECAETYLFFNNDTTDMFLLPTANEYAATDGNVIYKFEVAEDNTSLTFGIRCNIGQGHAATDGFDVCFWHPVLYKVLEDGVITPEQKSYLDNVQEQINALKGRIEVAEGYVADSQTELPWGKNDLKAGIAEAKKRVEAWETMTQEERLETMLNFSASYNALQAPYYIEGVYVVKDSIHQNNDEKALPNLIMNAGVRYINNHFINVFTTRNAPIKDMTAAISSALSTKESSFYSLGDKETLQKAIDVAQKVVDEIMLATSDATMDADSETLKNAIKTLADAVEAFKESAKLTPIISFDFENGYEKVAGTGENATSYVIKSNEGNAQMVFEEGNFQDEGAEVYTYSTLFQIAKSKSTAVNDGNILILGQNKNLLELTEDAIPTEEDVIRIDFTMYYSAWGNSVGNPEFKILDAENNMIAGYGRGIWNAMEYTTFGIESAQFYQTFHTSVGSGKDELKDCFALKGGARVDYQFKLDYKAKKMSADVIQYYGGTNVCEVEAITSGEQQDFGEIQTLPKYLSFASNMNNSGRRCSIDNLKIYKYKSTATSGISDVISSENAAAKAVKKIENGQIVIVKGGKKYNAVGVQVK